MACGRPLVVSDIPAHREILDERSASWVSPGDVGGIRDAVLGVLADPEAAARRAAVARSLAAQWSIADAASQYDRVYRDVLSRAGSGGTKASV
jgi:glycosyltransferase involved in cell wall biosynthesis